MSSDAPIIDHDRLFKELLTTFFLEFLELFAPVLHSSIEPDSVTFLEGDVFADMVEGSTLEPDLVARVLLRDADRSEIYCLIHVEAQSTSEAAFARRMHKYFSRLFDKYDLPIYPIALLSFDAPQRAEPDTFTVAFPDLEVLRFRFRTIQLNRLNWRDFVNQHNPIASALMAKMKIAPQDRQVVKFECLRLLATLRLDRARMRLIAGFVDTYLRLSWEENRHIIRQLGGPDIAATEAERAKVVEFVTSWQLMGREEGREEGIELVVVRQLTRRFGELAEATEAAVRDLPQEKLLELAEAIFDLTTQNDLTTWLTAHRKSST
jgi:hypothetical protein